MRDSRGLESALAEHIRENPDRGGDINFADGFAVGYTAPAPADDPFSTHGHVDILGDTITHTHRFRDPENEHSHINTADPHDHWDAAFVVDDAKVRS